MFINFYDKLINRFDTGAGLYTFLMLYRQKLPKTVGRGNLDIMQPQSNQEK